jgi:hypothetical protein
MGGRSQGEVVREREREGYHMVEAIKQRSNWIKDFINWFGGINLRNRTRISESWLGQ